MKLQYLAIALAAVVAAPAMAAEPAMSIDEVAQLTGVSHSDLRVLTGAQSTPGKYPLNYFVAKRNYERALQRLAGQGFALEVQDDKVQIVRVAGVSG